MTLVGTPLETLDYVTALAVSSPAAETAIVVTDLIQANAIQQPAGSPASQTERPVKVIVNANVTPGTGATALVFRVRQGNGVGGTVIGPGAQTIAVAAAAPEQVSLVCRDTSGVPFAPAGTVYTVTVTETGATVAGAVNTIDVEVVQ